MKRKIIYALVVTTLMMSGCAKKSVEIEAPEGSVEQPSSTQVEEGSGLQTVGGEVNEEDIGGEEAQLQKMKEIAAKSKKIYFDFDKYNIRPDQKPRVDYDAELFNSDEARPFRIKVEGNCDEWGTDEYNYALGLKRAKTVRDALAVRGVEPTRMSVISYGESNPVCTEHTRECWAKNRRVEFELLP